MWKFKKNLEKTAETFLFSKAEIYWTLRAESVKHGDLFSTDQCYKTFLGSNVTFGVKKMECLHLKLFNPSQIFE